MQFCLGMSFVILPSQSTGSRSLSHPDDGLELLARLVLQGSRGGWGFSERGVRGSVEVIPFRYPAYSMIKYQYPLPFFLAGLGATLPGGVPKLFFWKKFLENRKSEIRPY